MFHADDLVMSHADPAILTEHIEKLDGVHDNKDHLSITRGKLYEHLGMTIDFGLKRKVAISDSDFVKKMWVSSPEGLRGQCRSTLAPDCLFKVDKDAEVLDNFRKYQCHSAI